MPRLRTGAARGALVARAAAVLTLAAGYADLARGGTTLAAIALVAGYVVLVPVALLADRDRG
jgi:hypothetical protein